MQKNISINKDAVARAIREPLKAYYVLNHEQN